MVDAAQKRSEELKRERNWDPARRWTVIQETIDWADAQAAVSRNSREACLARQRRWMRREQTSG